MNVKLALVFLAAALLNSAVARSRASKRIIGGSDAERGLYPYQLSLQWAEKGGSWDHICGASVISENVAVTAGHCVMYPPSNTGSYRVVGGITKLDDKVDTRQEIVVKSITINPNYLGWTSPNDVAILKLSSNFKYNKHLKKIDLPESGECFTGKVNLTGWGTTEPDINHLKMPNHLQYLEMTLITDQQCKDALTSVGGSTGTYSKKSNICAGPLSGGYSACRYDSGGPLAKDGKLVGIVAWGITPCARKGAPTVFTQVATYVDFIKENM